jgi:hypothetical protein
LLLNAGIAIVVAEVLANVNKAGAGIAAWTALAFFGASAVELGTVYATQVVAAAVRQRNDARAAFPLAEAKHQTELDAATRAHDEMTASQREAWDVVNKDRERIRGLLGEAEVKVGALEAQLVDAKKSGPSRPEPLVIATERDAARFKIDTWIRRGEELEGNLVQLPDEKTAEETDPKTLLLFVDQLQNTERFEIEQWHRGVVAELEGLGGGALGLYNARESLSREMFALGVNRKFLADRLSELRGIRARLGEATLVVTSGKYGVPGKEADVRDRLVELIDADGVLDFTVRPDSLLVDPAPSEDKSLRVRWRENGEPKASEFLDGTHVVIPDSAARIQS